MNDVERFGRKVVRAIWDPVPSNDSQEPIWLLGQQYDARLPPPKSPPTPPPITGTSTSASTLSTLPPTLRPQADLTPKTEEESWIRTSSEDTERKEAANGQDPAQFGGWPHAFLDDFESRIWMTYRSDFAPIQKSQDPNAGKGISWGVRLVNLTKPGFTSDTGFGCMIRSGQCILANSLLQLRLGRDWRLSEATSESSDRPILALFADSPEAPFSIHRFVEHGAAVCGKYPGEWFGPSATARCIQDLTQKHRIAGLRVYVSGDGADVYEDNLVKVAKGEDEDEKWMPTLILVGTRLGIDKITPVYWEALKSALQLPQSIGIAGGRPSASHYFVGNQGNDFFYLDPHDTRPALPYHASSAEYTQPEVQSCHTRRLRRIEIREMDPSMLIAFLIRDEDDFERWKKGVKEVQGKAIVHVSKSEPKPPGTVPRESAIDEVESFDEHDDDDTETIV